MSLLPFLAIALGAGTAALLTRHRAEVSGTLGVGGLAAAAIAAALAPLLERLGLAATPPGVAAFVTLGAITALLAVLAGAGVGTVSRSLPGAALLTLGTSALALLAPQPGAAILFATAAGVIAVVPLLDPGAVSERGAVAAAITIRVAVLAGLAVLAAIVVAAAAPDDPAFRGLALVGVAAAVGARLGVIPLHRPAARLAGLAPLTALPLVGVWAPVALAWVAPVVSSTGLPPIERTLVIVLALAGIALAGLAALIHDDLPHVAGYGIALDGSVALVALAAAAGPATVELRTWLLLAAVTRTALIGWAIAAGGPAGVRRIAELRGWVRRSPMLAVALVAICAALVGWPGSAVWDSRAGILEAALGRPFGLLGIAVAAISVAAVGRLLVGGLRRPEPGDPREPRDPGGWRLRLRLATASSLLLAGLAVVVAAGWIG